MSIASTTLIAMSMSTDAFAASLAKGAHAKNPAIAHALKLGLIFGVVEFIMPLIGWILGHIAKSYVESFDHWIAFILLGIIGYKMIREGSTPAEIESETKITKNKNASFLRTVMTACSTSIDSLTVGISLSFLSVDIWLTAIAIGFATFTMSSIGILAGHYIGLRIGKIAELIGGSILIAIGLSILLTHLGFIG
ncbi:MAG: hypothetical protein CMH30_06275 [Micavibrio sp.]|nr:hypothetical protein [Micavibrio sp.]|tara:strand:+ start:4776 stop:5357 length:582 start_codon:yes stop_codon:yes gene_type:complete